MSADAIMVCSYGGPNRPQDVLPFLRNATKGRGIPDARLIQVGGHYKLFGGVSPINARNEEIMRELRQELTRRGIDVPVVIGNRNWHPFFTETMAELEAQGRYRVLCLFTSAFASYSGCRQYREDLAAAQAELGVEFALDKVRPYYTTEGFVAANVDAIVAAMNELEQAHLTLVTHSIPVAMNQNSGLPGDPSQPSYLRQHQDLGDEICRRVTAAIGRQVDVDLAFCSRSGPPMAKWLEPDINDRLQQLADEGVKNVVVAPIGFITDHMEVVYDLDTEARQTAADLGLGYRRAATAGTHPAFIGALADVICERLAPEKVEGVDPIGPKWPALAHPESCKPVAGYQKLPACLESK